MSTTDKHVEVALMKQRDAAVEALVWAFEERPGWREKIAWAVRQQPETLLACFKR